MHVALYYHSLCILPDIPCFFDFYESVIITWFWEFLYDNVHMCNYVLFSF